MTTKTMNFPLGGMDGKIYRQTLIDIIGLIDQRLVTKKRDIFFWTKKVSENLSEKNWEEIPNVR